MFEGNSADPSVHFDDGRAEGLACADPHWLERICFFRKLAKQKCLPQIIVCHQCSPLILIPITGCVPFTNQFLAHTPSRVSNTKPNHLAWNTTNIHFGYGFPICLDQRLATSSLHFIHLCLFSCLAWPRPRNQCSLCRLSVRLGQG